MSIYGSFASVYDRFMDNIPYDGWAEYLHKLLIKYHTKDGLLLELGCGTGAMTRRLRDFGYDMIGIDISEEMLQIAQSREQQENGGSILYLNQDMREFELYGTVAAVVSVCDTMNYITEEDELLQVFRLVNNYLDSRGVFIFDLKTEYFYRKELADRTFADNREDKSLIWENYYDEEERLNEYDITIYAQDTDGRFERFEETHCQKAWTYEEMKALLEKAGLEFVAAYDAFTFRAPKKNSTRLYFVAREQYQEGKQYNENE